MKSHMEVMADVLALFGAKEAVEDITYLSFDGNATNGGLKVISTQVLDGGRRSVVTTTYEMDWPR